LGNRAPIEKAVDRICRVFVPSVIGLAIAAFSVLIAMHTGVADALMRATTILVIACPCALGLATPLAITAAIGSASAKGILISDSSILETISRIDAVVLDKTGTVTQGNFRLLDCAIYVAAEETSAVREGTRNLGVVQARNEPEITFESCLPLLASVEAYSEHLLGRSVVEYAREHDVELLEAKAVEVRKGEGIHAKVAGKHVFVGNRHLVAAAGGDLSEEIQRKAREWQETGRTVAFFGWDGTVYGVLAFGDQVKSGARQMVQRLRKRGIRVSLVSGDAWPTTAAAAQQIGVDGFTAEASPADKVCIIEELQKSGMRVSVIGDGVNDAPALAQADLGIALGTGSDVAINASPVVLVGGTLSKVEEVFRLSERTSRVVRQNLFWAFVYNTLGLSLAIAGVLTPILAAVAMLFSSASVVGNSIRLTRSPKEEKLRQWV